MAFNDIKEHNGKKYTGMTVGRSHHWNYLFGDWEETKVADDLWKIQFSAIKSRKVPAPEGSGAALRTGYHWFILADQRVIKVSADEYETLMTGWKYKIGHRRPYWKRGWSYEYEGQQTYRQRLIEILRNTLETLEAEERLEQEGVAQLTETMLAASSVTAPAPAQKALV